MKRAVIIVTLISTLLLAARAEADRLALPVFVEEIGAEAFYGDNALSVVELPDGLLRIGPRAFANSSLKAISLPDSLVEIAPDAFDAGVSIVAPEGSYAFWWAAEHGNYLPGGAPAEDFTYTVGADGVTIDRYNGAETAVRVPDTIEGKPVVAIGSGSSVFGSKVVTVILPNTVRTLGRYAFRYCSRLQYVNLPEGIVELPMDVFYGCEKLAEITLPRSLTKIGDYAFSACFSLRSVNLPEGLTEIGSFAFHACAFEGLTVPDSVTTIGQYAFADCEHLTHVELPETLTSLPPALFSHCAGLREISLPDGIEEICENAFYSCENLTSVRLPARLKTLGKQAFGWCVTLPQITLPAGLTEIGEKAFESCKRLEDAALPDAIQALGENVFYDCFSLTRMALPPAITRVPAGLFKHCESLREIAFKGQITTIGDGAFSGTGFSSFKIPYTVTAIGANAFSGCKNLTAIVIPSGITRIEGRAFADCTSLTEVSLPEGLEYIWDYGFSGCTALESIHLPDSVKYLEQGAFSGCTSLRDINFPANLCDIDYNVFKSTGFTSLVLPARIAAIYPNAFSKCRNLTSITILGEVKTIRNNAFDGCVQLRSVSLPGTVTAIDKEAFAHCVSLRSISLPSGLKTIGEGAFRYSGLTSIYIPDSVTSIGSYAFSGCPNLSAIYGTKGEAWAKNRFGYPEYLYLAQGQTCDFPVYFWSSSAQDYTLTSADESIVTVNGHQITAVGSGSTSVTLSLNKAKIRVYVGLALNKPDLTVESGKTDYLRATYDVFLDTTDLFITGSEVWTSSDPGVAKVDDQGRVTGLNVGQAEITLQVTTNSGVMSASCMVTVVPAQDELDQIIDSIVFKNALTSHVYTIYFKPLKESGNLSYDYALYYSATRYGEYQLATDSWADNGLGAHFVFGVPASQQVYFRLLVTEKADGVPLRLRFTDPVDPTDSAYNKRVNRRIFIVDEKVDVENSVDQFNSPYNYQAMRQVFSGVDEVFTESDELYDPQDAAEVKTAMDNLFRSCDENDVSYIYITAHGSNVEVFEDGTENAVFGGFELRSSLFVTPATFCSWLEKYKGTFIVIADYCGSGELAKYCEKIGNVYVFSACGGKNQLSNGVYDHPSFFTETIAEGIPAAGPMPADKNGNGEVTVKELYGYIRINIYRVANVMFADYNFIDFPKKHWLAVHFQAGVASIITSQTPSCSNPASDWVVFTRR